MQILRILVSLTFLAFAASGPGLQESPQNGTQITPVITRRTSGKLIRWVNETHRERENDLQTLTRLCRDSKERRVVSMVEDNAAVADMFNALDFIKSAKCDGKIQTVLIHGGKMYNVQITEVELNMGR